MQQIQNKAPCLTVNSSPQRGTGKMVTIPHTLIRGILEYSDLSSFFTFAGINKEYKQLISLEKPKKQFKAHFASLNAHLAYQEILKALSNQSNMFRNNPSLYPRLLNISLCPMLLSSRYFTFLMADSIYVFHRLPNETWESRNLELRFLGSNEDSIIFLTEQRTLVFFSKNEDKYEERILGEQDSKLEVDLGRQYMDVDESWCQKDCLFAVAQGSSIFKLDFKQMKYSLVARLDFSIDRVYCFVIASLKYLYVTGSTENTEAHSSARLIACDEGNKVSEVPVPQVGFSSASTNQTRLIAINKNHRNKLECYRLSPTEGLKLEWFFQVEGSIKQFNAENDFVSLVCGENSYGERNEFLVVLKIINGMAKKIFSSEPHYQIVLHGIKDSILAFSMESMCLLDLACPRRPRVVGDLGAIQQVNIVSRKDVRILDRSDHYVASGGKEVLPYIRIERYYNPN